MNALGILLLSLSVQVCVVGMVCALMRRCARTHDSTITLAGLVVVLGLGVAALLPVPSWWELQTASRTLATAEPQHDDSAQTESLAAATPDTVAARTRSATPADDEGSWLSWMSWELLSQSAHRGADGSDRLTGATLGWRWPGVLAAICLLAMLAGLARLVIGLVAVASVKRRSASITDRALHELVDELRAALRVVRPVDLVETTDLATAATVGWWRPTILLPPEWRTWSVPQRRAVLAHELSHIRRGDGWKCLLAQAGVALQFYHPVVHWLAGRLQLEQELEADADAARLMGGQQRYLYALVELAIAHSDRTLGWPARNFLPTRGAFMRRIEMLRASPESSPRRSAFMRISTGLVLLTAGLMAAGLRVPGSSLKALAQEPAAAANNAPAELDLKVVPNDCIGLLIIRPNVLITHAALAPAAKMLTEQLNKEIGMDPAELTQVVFVLQRNSVNTPGRPLPFAMSDSAACIMRSKQPSRFEHWTSQFVPDPVKSMAGNIELYKSGSGQRPYAYFFPDEHTVVIDKLDTIASFMVGPRGNVRLTQGDLWSQVAGSAVIAALDTNFVQEKIAANAPPNTPQAALSTSMAMVAPLIRDTTRLLFGLNMAEKATVTFLSESPTAEHAERVRATTQALLTLGGNLLVQAQQQLRGNSPEQQVTMNAAMNLLSDVLKDTELTVEGTHTKLVASVPLDEAVTLGVIAPALHAQRMAAQRMASANNMKQIGVALYNYAEMHGHFPPPVLTGPDGKTKYSWRVALLPFLDAEALYKEYRLNEPWDSPDNQKVLQRMPAVYRQPASAPDTTETPYLAIVAPESIFADTAKGTSFADISDGVSNTLMMVETSRTVPWTKPEDFEVDLSRGVPPFPSLQQSGFLALLADSSVKFFSSDMNPDKLRQLITRAGNEVILGD